MKKKDLARKITSWLTLGAFSLQPSLSFAADIVADVSAPEAQCPYVTETATGIPLVQIARPDGSDVSVNRYEAFSVPESGAILNNAFLFSNTQLAGYIEGNPNLSGGPARIIVNEVMSDRPSKLRGFLEVAGTKADVIIANPNGIYVDGAGFLNASRAILAAGRTERDAAGSYAGFRIDDSRIDISGKGLDARGADSVEVYARAVAVNAGLWANHAKIVVGRNAVARDGSLSPFTSETADVPPQYAIDLADIGGMYANRIALVGTEKGLGVNLTGQISATQAVSLDVKGNLKTTGTLYSDGDLSVRSEQIENTNLIYGGNNTSITAKELTNKSGGRIYGNTVAINAENVTNETDRALEARLTSEVHTLSQYAAQVEAAHMDFTARDGASLSSILSSYRGRIGQAEAAYDAQQNIVNSVKDNLAARPAGVIAAHDQLHIHADTIQNTGNALLYSGGDIALAAGESLKNRGARIEAKGSIFIASPHIENENAAFAAKRSITNTSINPTKIRIDELGHIERGKAFPEWEFRNISSGYGAYHSHVAQKPIYERAAYEEIKQISPDEIAVGETPVPQELVGTLAPNYDYDDPIFATLGVTSMTSPRPAHGDPAQAAWDAQYRSILVTLNEKIDAYNKEAEDYNRTTAQAAGQKIKLLTFIETANVHSAETVTSSLPAMIRAGSSITLHGGMENTDSTISAGGTLRMEGALTEHAHMQQEQTVTLGTTQGSYTGRRNWLHRGKIRKFHGKVYMTPEVVRANPAPIGVHVIEENAAEESIEEAQRRRVSETLSPFGLASNPQAAGTGAGGAEHLSLSALYHVHSESTATYLVETDPAFTDRKKFLSSDYMYQRLKWDPNRIPKRVGDGFYEQQLLADQILRQTGKRHLDGYTDDETAFKALMDAGISYALAMNLVPGVALSKEQIAALTSDMIWLEEREVEVNGKRERAVYPVLYTKNTNGLHLTEGGSLISAKNIVVETKDALKNAGTLYGENIIVQAGEIEHTGRMRAKNIGLKSEHDIDLRGSLVGDKKVFLEAENNITAKSTTEKLAHQDVLHTTAGIVVKGDEGVLVASAGKNIELVGATLSALGKNGSVILSAGENISLDTKKLQSEKDMTESAENYLRTKRGTELGTEIRAAGNISIAAGNDLTARAATIASAEGTTSLAAGNDIRLTAGRESAEDHYGHRHTESGFLSSTRTTIRIDSAADEARGTLITGKEVKLTAKQDVTLQAANVLADNNTNIAAGRNFTAASEENYAHTDSFKEVKTSGLFSSGGLGFTIGTQGIKTGRDSSALTQAETNIAGFAGDVKITAGNDAHLTSASVLAGGNASITAKETRIDGRENIYRDVLTQESKTTGLTVSLGHGLLSLGQEIAAPLMRMGKVQDDRLKAAYAWKAGRLIHENFSKDNPLEHNSDFSLNLSLGTNKSYSRTESVTKEYAGSTISAGEKASITATEHDLTIQGSTVEGKDVALAAKQNIELLAGGNSNRTTTQNEASAAGIGVSFNPQGLSGLSLRASQAQGNSKENALTYTPTEIAAKDALHIESGKDTNILGSTVQGDKVTAKIGGNLNIETLQEKETYEEKNTSAGFDLSWDIRSGKFSKPTFGLSASRGTIDSHYRSARSQSGLFAGKEGFDLYVEKNTDLKGAVIASEAEKGKNRLTTGTISFSDLNNKAEYEANDIGVGIGIGSANGKTTVGGGIAVSSPAHDKAASTTKSAVAEGKITITNPEQQKQSLKDLPRNTENTLQPLGFIFDRDTVEERKEMANLFSELSHAAIGEMTLKLSPDQKRILNIAAGAITSYLGSGDYLSGATGAAVTEAMQKLLKNVKDPTVKELLIGIASAAAGKITNQRVGAVIASALNVEHFNHLPHEFQESFVDEVTNAPNNEAKLKVIEKYYALSQEFREAEPEKAEDMEEAFMDILETITKYDGCGIKFQVDREQGLHQNLAAANAFLQLNHYAQYLPAVFSNIVIATAATITAPVSVVSGVLKYGPATYEICTDIIREDDNALFIDTVKHTGIQLGSKYLEREVRLPKYIIIAVASGVKVYINANYKNKSVGD